ncbi:MAG: ribonuclease H-like domain-containing protein [Chlamydiota bacterium]|nr:ribonuclease H-like domain-containing protein [Chlamydiota bacterium]
MKKIVVFDVETKKSFDEVEGRKPELLCISVVGIYRYDTDTYQAFDEHELSQLNDIFGQSELIVGFNNKSFDNPALQPYVQVPLQKFNTVDILEDIKNALGHRVSLNSVAMATLKAQKSGDGLKAIRLYREGMMNELKSYCLDDVKLTKEVFDYGVKHGKIHYLSRDGQKILDVPVNWSYDNDHSDELTLF